MNNPTSNYKNQLQEYCHKKGSILPRYKNSKVIVHGQQMWDSYVLTVEGTFYGGLSIKKTTADINAAKLAFETLTAKDLDRKEQQHTLCIVPPKEARTFVWADLDGCHWVIDVWNKLAAYYKSNMHLNCFAGKDIADYMLVFDLMATFYKTTFTPMTRFVLVSKDAALENCVSLARLHFNVHIEYCTSKESFEKILVDT